MTILQHPTVQWTYQAGQATRIWADAQDWAMVRREARDLFVACVALAYTLGLYAGKYFYQLNVLVTRAARAAAGVSEATAEVKPKTEPLAGLTVAELRKLARAAGQSRAWCRVARRTELLELLG